MAELIAIFLFISTVVYGIVLLVAAFEYITYSLFLYKLAQANEMKGRWKAWVPIIQLFYMGEIAAEAGKSTEFKDNYFFMMGLSMVLSFFGGLFDMRFLTTFGIGLAIVFIYMAFYKIYESYVPALPILFAIFSMVNPIAGIIQIIFILNKDWYIPRYEEEYVQSDKYSEEYKEARNEYQYSEKEFEYSEQEYDNTERKYKAEPSGYAYKSTPNKQNLGENPYQE